MDVIQYLHPLTLPALVTSLILLWSIAKWLRQPVVANKNRNLPPGPRKLPLIGNLHLLSRLPHKDFCALSQKHGPLMHFHFGDRAPALIVSSADAAREIFKTHDLNFADRPRMYGFQNKLLFNGKNVTFSPYGEQWRRMKSIFVHQVLSSKRVQSFRYIREQETTLVVKDIKNSLGSPVNLSEMLYNFTNDVICRTVFGHKYSKSDIGKKIIPLFKETGMLVAKFSLELIPCLRWINHLNGLYRRVDFISREVNAFLEGLIDEHMRNPKGEENGDQDFVDIILSHYNEKTDGVSFDRDVVKAMVQDAYAGGTDTMAIAVEWVMTELLRHPKVMEKLQKEVRGIVKDTEHEIITDDDLEKMHYLKAVIKETLRCHPQNPLLIPRLTRKDVNIMGYDISAGTLVFTNAWAILMDPASWQDPEKFMPERFLNSSIDYRGKDFEFIPFGAGRRGCPGIAFSEATIELFIATLVHKFNWELPGGAKGEDLDMTEYTGIPIRRANPLVAVATKPKVN